MRIGTLALLASVALMVASCAKKDDSIKLFPVKAGEKWGYVDSKGQYVINAQFMDAYNFSEGLALVKASDDKYGYIGEDGKYVINPIYKDAASFSDGLACVVMENGKIQVIDKGNKILFTVDQADYCASFKEGRARVKVKGKWGFIDKTGTMVVNPIYEDVGYFSEGLAPVAKKVEGKEEVLWGYIDANGGVKIDFQFMPDTTMFDDDGAREFSEGKAFASSNGKEWGCIDVEGKYQINPQFEGLFEFPWKNQFKFNNGLAVISQGGNYGYIDHEGKYAVNPQFIDARRFAANGLAAVQNSDKKWGFINTEGKYEINPQFDDVAHGFFGGVAFVKTSDKYGMIDEKGRYIVNPQFDNVYLYGVGANFGVTSDYVDYEGIAQKVFERSSRTAHLGYSMSTTLGDLIDEYPDVDVSSLEAYSLDIGTPKADMGELVDMPFLRIGFDEKTYSETPVYKTVQKWSYYYGTYYSEKEFDRMEKKVQISAPVSWLGHALKLHKDGKGKGRSLAEALKREAAKKMAVTEVNDLGVMNTDAKGMFVLQSEELFVLIRYWQEEEDDDREPTFWIMVSNSSNDEPFEILRNKVVKKFNSE